MDIAVTGDRASLTKKLLNISKGIKTDCLINLGGNKNLNDCGKFLTNALKGTAFALSGRNILYNDDGEVCFSFLVKTINFMFKIFPKTVAGISLAGLQRTLETAKLLSSIFDALVNYRKVIKSKMVVGILAQLTYEFLKMYGRAFILNTAFGRLSGTEFQILIGPIIYLMTNYVYAPEDSLSPEMNFVRDAAEEIISIWAPGKQQNTKSATTAQDEPARGLKDVSVKSPGDPSQIKEPQKKQIR